MQDSNETRATVCRLSFWAPPDRMEEFEAVYEKNVAPLLKEHGWVSSSCSARRTIAKVFSRLFEFQSPEIADKWQAVRSDSIFQAVLKDLGTTFGTTRKDSLIRTTFRLYSAPAGTGTVSERTRTEMPAGRGSGRWQTYDVEDGLAGAFVSSIIQDREGALWFGTGSHDAHGGGVSRYDGQTWTTFTTKDGLAHNNVLSILQDHENRLWFGTYGGGVSRYDGQTWTTFTTEDGLGCPVSEWC